jgi:tRNA-Thr(GGU) m(6)t(6)A37 methyltransferase TsaA
MSFEPIGVARTPFATPADTRMRTTRSAGAEGTVELRPELAAGLADLAGFERIWVIWHAHLQGPANLIVQPPFQTPPKGVFATRSPRRPNSIGLSCLRLLAVEGNVLRVADVDMVDGTPVLDIKPYSRWSDCWPNARCGWLEDVDRPGDNPAESSLRKDWDHPEEDEAWKDL